MNSGAYDCIVSANELLAAHSALVFRVRATQRLHRRQLRNLALPPQGILTLPLIPSPPRTPSPSPPSSPITPPKPKPHRPDLPPAKRARLARYNKYVPEEETIRNDYSQRYVDGGEWPQDWVLGADPEHRFEEYPKQQRLLALKKASVAQYALPPVFLPYAQLSTLHPSKFDVILIDPPFSSSFTWDNLQELPIPALAADPSYVFMWVGSGSGEGLERGREVMAKWGFRRCEDIVWVKTNKTTNHGPGTDPPTTSLLTRTKQHCLMGIRGTVRRSTDSWFVHCNVDTDVMIWEGDPSDPTLKPPEMYTLIENFCLGLRRLEIFGRAQTARRGWVTALAEGEEDQIEEGMVLDDVDGADLRQGAMKWDRESWEAQIKELASGGKAVVPMTQEIDALRPKSPVRGSSNNLNAGMGAALPANPAQIGMAMPMGIGMPGHSGNNPHQNRGGFQNAGRMVQPMMAMANMGAGDVSMMGWPEMGMNMVGMNMGAPMGGMNGMNAMGMGVGQQGMGFPQGTGGFGGFDGGQMHAGMGMDPSMGWMPGAEGQMWDGSMGEGMVGMNGMNNMGMGMNMPMGGNMNSAMGMGGMGMGQWGGEGY